MTRTTGVIFSPVLGRTFFLPGFGASSSLTEVDDELDEVLELDEDLVLDEDDELDEELELDEDDELDEELELDEDDELDEELELDEDDELDEDVVLGVGGVCSFSPNPSPDPVSNRTSRVKLRGAGKLVAVHFNVLWTISPTLVPGATFVEYSIYIGQL